MTTFLPKPTTLPLALNLCQVPVSKCKYASAIIVTWTQVDTSHCVDDMSCLFFLYKLDAAGKTEGSWWK